MPGTTLSPRGTLNAGEEFLVKTTAPIINGARPARMSLKIELILFDDRSWFGDPQKALRIFNSRRDYSEEMGAVLDAMRSAESSADADKRYREILASWKIGKVERYNTDRAVRRIEEYRKFRGTPLFDQMVRLDESVMSVTREHSIPATPIAEEGVPRPGKERR